MPVTSNQLRVEAAVRSLVASGRLSPGSRLPTFRALAETLGTSVSVLQQVVPRLVADGILEVRPSVGTFVRRLPSAEEGGGSHAGVRLRLQIAETAEWCSKGWRRLAAAFEASQPGVRIELALHQGGADPVGALRRPDVELVQHRDVSRLLASGRYVPWADAEVWRGGSRLAFARTLREPGDDQRMLPLLVGHVVLLVARGAGFLPAGHPSGVPRLIESLPRPSDGFGLLVADLQDPLLLLGFGGGRLAVDRPALEAWVGCLRRVQAPRLVTVPDLDEEQGHDGMLRCLVEQRAQGALVPLWMARFADPAQWTIHPPPGDGPIPSGALVLLVPEGPRSEAAVAFARFAAGDAGQAILAATEPLLPSLASCVAGHRSAALVAAAASRGAPSLDGILAHDPAQRGVRMRDLLADVRVGRVEPEEAVERILAADRACVEDVPGLRPPR